MVLNDFTWFLYDFVLFLFDFLEVGMDIGITWILERFCDTSKFGHTRKSGTNWKFEKARPQIRNHQPHIRSHTNPDMRSHVNARFVVI